MTWYSWCYLQKVSPCDSHVDTCWQSCGCLRIIMWIRADNHAFPCWQSCGYVLTTKYFPTNNLWIRADNHVFPWWLSCEYVHHNQVFSFWQSCGYMLTIMNSNYFLTVMRIPAGNHANTVPADRHLDIW
jgi:hypothetical protein